MSAQGPIESLERGAVRVLRMTHGKANAFDLELFEAMIVALGEAERDGCRALVITGSESIFSAGVDLRRLLREGEEYLRRFVPRIGEGFRRLFAFQLRTRASELVPDVGSLVSAVGECK